MSKKKDISLNIGDLFWTYDNSEPRGPNPDYLGMVIEIGKEKYKEIILWVSPEEKFHSVGKITEFQRDMIGVWMSNGEMESAE